MNAEMFQAIVSRQFEHCRTIMEVKAKEYATSEDRLEHFRISAQEQETNTKNALWGMASKHLTSLGRMCREDSKDMDLWLEKITDAMNYLALLVALVYEEAEHEKH